MSKMSELYRELSEQAVEMGYSSLEYATDVAGCGIDYVKGRLLPPEEAAHNALLKEKEEIIEDLEKLVTSSEYDKRTKARAIEFIKQEVK